MRTSTVESPEFHSVPIGDGHLSCLHYAGKGPPLLLLHATGFSPWLWHPVARELAGDYRVLAPALGDRREADPEAGGLDWSLLAEDVVRLCAALGIERPFLAGHSMGATVAVLAHARFGLPAAGMVLIEPILLPPGIYGMRLSVEQHPLASRAIRRTNFWRDRDEARAYLRSRPLFQSWDEESLDLYLNHGLVEGEQGGICLACSPRREASLFMGGRRCDPWPLLAKVACPVLILEGDRSEYRGFIDLERVREGLPEAELCRVERAGHLIPMERPRQTARLIGDFLRRRSPAAA